MTEPVTWAVLTGYYTFAELLVMSLPDEQWPSIKELVLVVDTRAATFERIAALSDLKDGWSIRVVPGSVLIDDAKTVGSAQLERYVNESLGIKLMLPRRLRPPFLMTDDDLIVRQDPGFLFIDRPWGSQTHFDPYSRGNRDQLELADVNRAFELNLSTPDFNSKRSDMGMFYSPTFDIEQWDAYLEKFFGQPNVPTAGGHRFRRFDQRFLTGWLRRMQGGVLGSPTYRVFPYSKPPKSIPPTAAVVHYCASSHKMTYVRWLRDQLGIHGLPDDDDYKMLR